MHIHTRTQQDRCFIINNPISWWNSLFRKFTEMEIVHLTFLIHNSIKICVFFFNLPTPEKKLYKLCQETEKNAKQLRLSFEDISLPSSWDLCTFHNRYLKNEQCAWASFFFFFFTFSWQITFDKTFYLFCDLQILLSRELKFFKRFFFFAEENVFVILLLLGYILICKRFSNNFGALFIDLPRELFSLLCWMFDMCYYALEIFFDEYIEV